MNYKVPEAVWLATATMAYEKIKEGTVKTVMDVVFRQAEIQGRARQFTKDNVDNARISQWCNADHSNNTYNYLRDVNGKRRLVFSGEFQGVKERPDFNLNDQFSLSNGDFITIAELVAFYENEYTALFTSDFKKILKHLYLYANEIYENPEKLELTEEKKAHYLVIKKSGTDAVQELDKFANSVATKYELINKSKTNFHVAKKETTVRAYLWNQLVLEEFKEFPTSLSIFAEKIHNVERIRVAIELDVKKASPEDIEKHHSLLNLTLKLNPEEYFYYVTFKDDSERTVSTSLNEIKRKYKKGEYTRVQLCYAITHKEIENLNLTNEAISKKLYKAIEDLLPYYRAIMDGTEVELPNPDEVKPMHKLNTILYGPPGTGKTYNTAIYAVAIIENKSIEVLRNEDYSEILKRYNQFKNSGQIAFTTFHQSYGYEEFIEGIKPKLNAEAKAEIQYEIAPGIFKEFCTRAQSLKVTTSDDNYEQDVRVWKISIGGSGSNNLKTLCFEHQEIRIGWPNENIELAKVEGYSNDSLYYFYEEMKEGDIVFSLGDQKHIDAIGIITGEVFTDNEHHDNYVHTRKVQWIATGINERIFEVNGHKNLTQQTIYPLRRIAMEAVNQIISKYVNNSTAKVQENNKNYVFIIDEINRGNISKILGELITLIEPTKRLKEKEAMTVTLPYSQEPFGVPDNVYILGTMNTADRSIALMDTALRRRFQFIEMLPDAKLLQNVFVENIDVQQMVETINKRIEVLYDREHTIGHAYFMGLKDEPSITNLARIFENAIIPLLQEYFYEDYSKIQLILGDNAKPNDHKFILDKQVQNVFKGNPDIDVPDYNYEIQFAAFRKKESYIAIYK